jgi:formylglycine-generating enzyme required for sulfatase activity
MRIAPGAGKVVTWAASADFPGFYYPQVVAKVIANDGMMASSEMVLVPAGNMQFGYSIFSGTRGTVFISAFMLDKYEVTNAEFQRFIDAGGYSTRAYWSFDGWNRKVAYNWTAPSGWNTAGSYVGASYPGFPVSGVSWYEAEAYANFVGKRLPTEAEWERACGTRVYAWGDTMDSRRVNFANSGDPNDNFPTPVGYFNGTVYQNIFQTRNSPSPYGAYDLMGNVAEWIRDWSSPPGSTLSTNYSGGGVDPVGPSSGSYKMIRGGSFLNNAQVLVSRYHQINNFGDAGLTDGTHYRDPATRWSNVGFRLVRPVTQ